MLKLKWIFVLAAAVVVVVAAVVPYRDWCEAQSSRTTKANRKAGNRQTIVVSGIGLELVWIPPGEFTMGSPDFVVGRIHADTPHRVLLTNGFWMGQYEVTQELFEKVMGSNPSKYKGARYPVEQVTWDDCQEFIKKLNGMVEGGGFRLPTEVEWEYSCRAGTKTRFYTGDAARDLDAAGWYSGCSGQKTQPVGKNETNTWDLYDMNLDAAGWYIENSGGKTHPVGKKKANAWGLYDMHGNVYEWCLDLYGPFPDSPLPEPYRVRRGGGWGSYAGYCRSSHREYSYPSTLRNDFGFRISRPLP